MQNTGGACSLDAWLLPVFVFACVLVISDAADSAEPTPAQKLVDGPRVLIVAHRGDSGAFPENTLPAFQSAVDVKADFVELDYYHSADGVPVVIHDDVLDRTTNAKLLLGKEKLAVAKLPLADLQKLDAGSWFGQKFAGAKLPTLIESLDLIQTGSTTLIERKAGDAKTLVKLLDDKKLTDRVVVQAFDWEFVAECRKLSPRLVLGALCGKPADEEKIRGAVATGADVIVWNHEKLEKEHIDLIHQLGKRAWVYTVDDPDRARWLLKAGIDGIITNRPAEMRALRERSQGSGVRKPQ
ncbi:MAG TPA: glycerophosphodiester phosphodiesterase family protein [Pirellulaceae bacterium]|nr:glycerophosphodiester phosphodiesterase family protein [Pirellulaceae bacterium]